MSQYIQLRVNIVFLLDICTFNTRTFLFISFFHVQLSVSNICISTPTFENSLYEHILLFQYIYIFLLTFFLIKHNFINRFYIRLFVIIMIKLMINYFLWFEVDIDEVSVKFRMGLYCRLSIFVSFTLIIIGLLKVRLFIHTMKVAASLKLIIFLCSFAAMEIIALLTNIIIYKLIIFRDFKI